MSQPVAVGVSLLGAAVVVAALGGKRSVLVLAFWVLIVGVFAASALALGSS